MLNGVSYRPDRNAASHFIMAMRDVYANCSNDKQILDINQLTIQPIYKTIEDMKCNNQWSSDDAGYHYYYDGCYPSKKDIKIVFDEDEEAIAICPDCDSTIQFHVSEGY